MASAEVEQTHTNGTAKTNGTTDHHSLSSNWPMAFDLAGSNQPCRLEGEVADLVVFGKIPDEIDGTFYRMMSDPFVPPHPGNVPLDGDGTVSALRFRNGRVDLKVKYVETERYKLERKAGKALFGLYRNPFTHHPCVRNAIDSTANTNIILWADRLLALKEGGLPYSMDPNTLETQQYDPFGQIKSKTFSAHPKLDPYSGDLVCYGYEAKGLGSLDIVIYTLDPQGKAKDEQWIKSPWCAPIHDCAITPNFIILVLWPFDGDVERMKQGKHHWAYNYNRPATFVVAARSQSSKLPRGWKPGEVRTYHWENAMLIHTAGAWESPGGEEIFLETSRVHDNAFPFFPADDGRLPSPDAKADYVRWKFDLQQPDGTKVPDPELVLDVPCEFPRIDERFMSHKYNYAFLDVFMPQKSDGGKNLFNGLNGLAMHNIHTGDTKYFYAGDDSFTQEPIFIPRSDGAEEGDGWVMAMIERRVANRNDLVVLDTRDFCNPIAVVQLPFHLKSQVHGNWVPSHQLGARKPLVKEIEDFVVSQRGALVPDV